MAYKVSQLRKKSGSSTGTYMQTISVEETTFTSPDKFHDNSTFTDFALSGAFTKGQTYYLRFMVHRVPMGWFSKERSTYDKQIFANSDELTYTVLLKIQDEDEDAYPPQIIDTITIDSLASSDQNIGNNTRYKAYTMVFTPSRNFNLLGFRLARNAYDGLYQPRTWLENKQTSKTIYNIQGGTVVTQTISVDRNKILYSGENGDICKLNNILTGAKENVTEWLKMGFQSRPGTLIVVNQQPIRVGRSGTYEINNGATINSFMITAPQGSDDTKIDAFLLDYAYNE